MRSIRISIVTITFTLLMFGLVMVYSTSAIYASQAFGDSMFFLKRHLLFLLIGCILSFLAMLPDCEDIRDHSKTILGFAIVLLVMVFIPGIGKSAGGAQRWIRVIFFNLQPSEIAKVAMLIYMADFIGRRESRVNSFLYGYLPPLAVIGMLMFLVLLEPDLGTAVSIGVVGFLMLFLAGVRVKYLLATVLAGLPFIYYIVFSVPYRKRRILTFIDPWIDQQGAGFQIVQSFLALGSGGLFGVGLGQSKQKLFFLPASHTDFIFSIIGEELGFIGVVAVLFLFAALIWQGARAAFKAEDIFRKMLIFGIILTIGFEVIVNVGVSTGLLPTKGLPLPFISYGGTSLIMHMVAIGLLLNATRE